MNSDSETGALADASPERDGFSPLLQAPARLQIVALLSHVQDAEFQRLKDLTGCSDSVMSKHLAALVDAGLVTMHKAPFGGRSRTWASLTRAGRTTLQDHVAALQHILAGGQSPGVV